MLLVYGRKKINNKYASIETHGDSKGKGCLHNNCNQMHAITYTTKVDKTALNIRPTFLLKTECI